MKNNLLKLLLIPLLIFAAACNDESEPTPPLVIPERGDIIETEFIATISSDLINLALDQFDEDIDIEAEYAITMYKIVYYTEDVDGNITPASGLLTYPNGPTSLPMASIQHGTQTEKSAVGSADPLNSVEGVMGLLGAGLGYYSVVPDYLGFGESNISIPPYHHYKTSAGDVLDIIRAGRRFAEENDISLSGELFLAGYSEGGYVTMAAHKEIEDFYPEEFNLTASAPMAGAYDLELTATTVIEREVYESPSFLAYIIVSYNNIYNWNRIDQIFNEPYATRVPILYAGTFGTDEINEQLNDTVSVLFTNDFIDTYLAGNDAQLNFAFDQNSLLNWAPAAPMHLFHGNADEFVPYENALRAKASLEAAGAASIELTTIEGGTHGSALFPSLLGAIMWFEQLQTATLVIN